MEAEALMRWKSGREEGLRQDQDFCFTFMNAF